MKNIVPIALFVTSIAGILCSLAGMLFSLFSFSNNVMIVVAVPMLVVSCIINAFPIVGGISLNSRLIKSSMIISILAYSVTLISFILLLSR